MRLDQIMSAPVSTIAADASVAEARVALQRAGVGHLVVLGRGAQIAGVLCRHDLRGALADDTVADVMSAPAVTLSADADVKEAARLLHRNHVGCLPVMRRGRLAGIVTTSDLLALLGKGALKVQAGTVKWTLPGRGPTHRREPRRA